MTDAKCMQATPHGTLLEQIMDSSQAKTEREWAAAREIESLRQQLTAANERIRELEQSHTEASALFADCVAGQADLRRKLTTERAISDKLAAALANYATDETADGWAAITALAEVEAMRKANC